MQTCITYDMIVLVGYYLLQRGVRKINKLAQVRKEKGLTQAALSDLSGVSRITIARYEIGAISPSVRNLEKLSGALGVGIADIIGKAG